MKLTRNLRIGITVVVTLLLWSHIAWDHFHGGIPTHYLLHDKNLPGIPNWLGGLVLPFFTWFLLFRIHKRIDEPTEGSVSERLRTIIIRFLLAMAVSIALALFFTFEISLIDYIMPSIAILAFFFQLYKSEYLLGWIVGSTFTFGAMIPIAFGCLFALVFYAFYKVPRNLYRYFQSKKG